jgi:hypothetical protein
MADLGPLALRVAIILSDVWCCLIGGHIDWKEEGQEVGLYGRWA